MTENATAATSTSSTTGGSTPSPGRIVHYVLPEESGRKGEHRAAMMTSGWQGPNQNLTIYLDQTDDLINTQPGGMFARVWSAKYSEGHEPGTWHWPERV